MAANAQLAICAKLLLPNNFFICVSAYLFASFTLSIQKILKDSIQLIFEFFMEVAHCYFLRVDFSSQITFISIKVCDSKKILSIFPPTLFLVGGWQSTAEDEPTQNRVAY